MIQTTKTYVQLVNEAIDEAGDELASFASDGSDFTTNANPMMQRFKRWVNQAWVDIQQESPDWEWMSEQAVVNITPGLMFYSEHLVNWSYPQANPLDIYDNVGDVVVVPDQEATKLVDLTGTYTQLENFGYVNLDSSVDAPLNYGLKAGGEYFLVGTNSTIRIITSRDVSNYTVGTEISSIVLNLYDTDHIIISTGTYTLTGTITNVESVSGGGTNTVLTINFSHIAPTFWNDYLTSVPPAFGAALELNGDGNPLTVSGASNIGTIDSAITPETYTVLATGFVDVIGGTISSPIDIETATITIASGLNTLVLTGGTIDAADDATSCTFTIIGEETNIIGGTAFTLFSRLASADTNFDHFDFTAAGGRSVSIPQDQSATVTTFSTTAPESETFKNYVHSWKSFDWSEELDDDDFVENVREVNQKTFRIISHEQPAISRELPLDFMPWETFQNRWDFASMVPSTPRFITEDNVGRWRFYPPPDMPYTILFDYVREPQELVNFDDVPQGLPHEYYRLIIHKTLEYYGLYDEQPSLATTNPMAPGRAQKMYKDLLMKFNMQTREKFHFKPRRTY
jgi:hypothetical protein